MDITALYRSVVPGSGQTHDVGYLEKVQTEQSLTAN